jgi:hypothetical protein
MKASKTKARRAAKSEGAKVEASTQIQAKSAVKPAPAPAPAPTSTKATEAMVASVLEASKNNSVQNESIMKLIEALEAQMNQNRLTKDVQPVRLKVHRNEKTTLIEYIDVVPVEVKIVKH